MMSHELTASNLDGPAVEALRLALTLATPVFFCLFGMMQQIVYAPRFEGGRRAEIAQRLWARALQCWALYVFSCAVMCLSGNLSFLYFIRCAILMGDTHFTDILRFYAVMLFLAPFLLQVSTRYGLWPLVVLSIAIHGAFPLISRIGPIGTFHGADSFSSFIYGGDMFRLTGPSVIHGLAFVVAGMVMGKLLQMRPGREMLLSGPGWTVRLVWLGMVAACIGWVWLGHYDITDGSVRNLLRNSNHPLYLLLGVTEAVLYIDFFSWLRRTLRIGTESLWMAFGRTGLFTFAYGNSFLYLVALPNASDPPNAALFLMCGVTVAAMSLAYYRFRALPALKSDHPAARLYRAIVDESAIRFVRLVTGAPARPPKAAAHPESL